MTMRYTTIIEHGPVNFSAYAPDFPGCVAAADTEAETMAPNMTRANGKRENNMSTAQLNKAFAVWPQVEPALRVPHNDREYRQLVKQLDRLVDEVGEDENHPLASMMEVIGVLIDKYEDENVAEVA
jgi:HTH-type transcriptional regulator/antitoxin HigA